MTPSNWIATAKNQVTAEKNSTCFPLRQEMRDDNRSIEFLYQELSRSLTPQQEQALDIIWAYHLKHEKPCPVRTLQHRLGSTPVNEILTGLNGSILLEAFEGNARCLAITLLGSLLTGHGNYLFALLVRLLSAVKEAIERNCELGTYSNVDATAARFSDHDLPILPRLLALPAPVELPYYLQQRHSDGTWTIAIRDEITNLYVRNDVDAYLDDIFRKDFESAQPISLNERLASILPPPSGAFPHTQAAPSQSLSSQASFVSKERLSELKGQIREEFDIRRLVRMCEELNDCATRNNAHAVIMLTRAILDHVPPIFKQPNFASVASQYTGGRSFKSAMENLQSFSRNIADMYLHSQIRKVESLPNMTTANCSQALDILLGEIVSTLKS